MEKLFSLLMITFTLSALLFLSGISTGNPTSAISMLNDIMTNGLLGSSIYTKIFLGIFATLTLAAGVNAISFGNSSAATTIASVALVTYFVSLLSEFRYLVVYVHDKCTLDSLGNCNDPIYYIVWFISILIMGAYIYSAADYVLGGGD